MEKLFQSQDRQSLVVVAEAELLVTLVPVHQAELAVAVLVVVQDMIHHQELMA